MAWIESTWMTSCLVGLALASAACGGSGSDAADDGADDRGPTSGGDDGQTSADDDGQTSAVDGGQTDGGDTGADEWNCGMHLLESLDEDCEGIGSVQPLLDLATVEQMSQLEWSSYEDENVTHTPFGGTTALTIRLRYDGGELRCFHYCDPCPGLPCGAAGEPARIEVDVFAEVTTEDGALAEDWPVVLSSEYAPQTSFSGTVPTTSVAGTLTVELLSSAFEEPEVGISGLFAEGLTSGTLTIFAHSPEPNGPAITGPLATWPAP